MRGTKNGDTTAPFYDAIPEENFELILEREVAAFESGKADERLRQRAEELGLPFASLAARLSAALALQGKRSSMSLLQMRRSSAGAPDLLRPEMEMGRRPYGLLQRQSETERADSANSHPAAQQTETGVLKKPRAPLTPDMLKDITLRFRSGATNNNVSVAYGISWPRAQELRQQLAPGAAPVYLNKGGRRTAPVAGLRLAKSTGHGGARPTARVEERFTYQEQRQIASRVHTAKRNGGSLEKVARDFGTSLQGALKIYNRFAYKPSTPGHTYVALKPQFRTPARKLTPITKKPTTKKYHKLSAAKRQQLGQAVVKALAAGQPVNHVAKKFGTTWFTARECYQQLTGKDMPKLHKAPRALNTAVKTAPVLEVPKAAAAGA